MAGMPFDLSLEEVMAAVSTDVLASLETTAGTPLNSQPGWKNCYFGV